MSGPSDEEPSSDAPAGPRDGDVEEWAADARAETSSAQEPAGEGAAEGGSREGGEPWVSDPNVVAIEEAEVDARMTEWLHQVAGQVDPRLDRVAPDWRQREQAQAARACAFGLLLAHLARGYPHAREAIDRVVEHHPSYSTFTAGERLPTLERIVADPASMAAWIGPLIDVTDSERVRSLLE